MSDSEPRALRGDVANDNLNTLLRDIHSYVEQNPTLADLGLKINKAATQFNEFELLPKLLDGKLQWYVDTISSTYMLMHLQKHPLAPQLAELIYVISKVRGYKVVAHHFSNDVYLIPKLIGILKNETLGGLETFLVLMWLSSLVMVPFPLATIDEGLEKDISSLAVKYLGLQTNASKSQLISLVLLSNLLTRPDCTDLLLEYVDRTSLEWVYMHSNSKLGHLMALNQILKRFSNATVAGLAQKIHTDIVTLDISQLKHNPGYQVNSLHILYLGKVSTKVARIAINEKDYNTAAVIVNHFILDIIGSLGDRLDATLRESTAKNLSRIVTYLQLNAVNYATQLIWFVVEQLQLPQLTSLAGFVEHLGITTKNLSVSRYHTVLLFLGFLALNKTAPAEFLPIILSVFHSTCTISKFTFTFVQGSLIRDASCFCAWAVIRSLSPDKFRSLLASNGMWNSVFADLLRITLFDEDFTIRRCGIAVLQEFIGRFGQIYFKRLSPGMNANEIGELTLKFIELFDSSAVSSHKDAHDLVIQIIELGIPKTIFYDPLLEHALNDEVPYTIRKLSGHTLARILAITKGHVLWPSKHASCKEIVSELLKCFMAGDFLALYSLAELMSQNLLRMDQIHEIESSVSREKFDHHHDRPEKAESLLHWYNANHQRQHNEAPHLEHNLISIARVQSTDGLVDEFNQLFNFFVDKKITPINVHEVIRHFQHGNSLLAQTSMVYVLANNGLGVVMTVISDSSVDAEARADLVLSLTEYVPVIAQSEVYSSFCNFVLTLLDDYTLTNQGDVGLKVRGACLGLLERNGALAHFLASDLEAKLLRLAGEPMDKLRVRAFCFLCKLRKFDCQSQTVYLSDYRAYFQDLSAYYNDHVGDERKTDFWSGIVHTLGATTGNNQLTNASLKQVLLIIHSLNGTDEVVLELLKLLRIPNGVKVSELDQRVKRTFNATLTLLGRLFESGLEVSSDFPVEALFIRAYNLHINTNDVARVRQVLKIFQFISVWPNCLSEYRNKCRKRLCWITCLHPLDKVRLLGCESLFEIANELSLQNEILRYLEETDWGRGTRAHSLRKLEGAFLKM